MQYIDLTKLFLISPRAVVEGKRLNYYGHRRFGEGDILFDVSPEETKLYKVGLTECEPLKKPIRIGCPSSHHPPRYRYWIRTHLQEVPAGPVRDAILEELVNINALPY